MKYALVTGGSRGLGAAICLDLADLGYNILINYVANTTAAESVKAQVEEKGVKAELLKFDVSSKEDINAVLGTWISENADSQIEVLVNNAGIRRDGLFMWMDHKDWSDVVDASLTGFFCVTKLVLDGMIKEKFGRIINMSSFSGLKGVPGQTNYSASRAAIIGATRSLAQEIGRRKITVNAVAPGFIKTDMTEEINEADYKKVIPVGRFGEAKEVSSLVKFLASKEASYITGEVISVNGGL